MNLSPSPALTPARLRASRRSSLQALAHLTPETLARQIDAFHAGHLRPLAHTFDAIERRDDVLQSVAHKRKLAAARYGWEVIALEDGPVARRHKRALEAFYNHCTATNALDENEQGGFPLLVRQMMDAIGKRYAVHEIVWRPLPGPDAHFTADFRFVPLWFFDNRQGRLRFLESDQDTTGIPLAPGSWLTTAGPGILEACAIAYLYKSFALRDWVLYCERNGMPGVKGVTDALPGTPEWDAARQAVESFGAEFSALMTRGTDIQPIDLAAKGDLPYPALVERMDRSMIILWRGSDLSTISRQGAIGASVQLEEPDLLADGDAAIIAEALNTQVNRPLIQHLFGESPRAYLEVRAGRRRDPASDLQLYRTAWEMGLPIAVSDFLERFGLPQPNPEEALLPPFPKTIHNSLESIHG